MTKRVLLLGVSALFFVSAVWLLVSAPSDSEAQVRSHPCPLADALGLDEHSHNPHDADGGHLPPLSAALRARLDPTSVTRPVRAEPPSPSAADPDATTYVGRSDFDTMPPVPPSHFKQEL